MLETTGLNGVGWRGRPARTRDRFLVFGAPDIQEEDIQEVVACLRSGWIGSGPRVAQFEQAFRAYKGTDRAAVAVNSCTAALHLALLAAGVGPGDEVITTALTFCATVNAIVHAGATPVLVDVNPLTMNLNVAELEGRLTPRTRAVVAVHFAGRPCEMEELVAFCEKHGLVLVEDCAHAIETMYHGVPAGTFGDFSCFSFYVTKSMTTGEGGILMARRAADADRLKMLALHGLSRDAWKRYRDDGYRHYQVESIGFKYNMTDLQAALGLHQLERLDRNWARRGEIVQEYTEALAELPLGLPAPPAPGTRHGQHLYPILIDEARTGVSRDEFLVRMAERNIGVGVHYLAIPEHPVYRERYGLRPEEYPHARRIGQETVSLPLSGKLEAEDVADVIAAVYHALERA